MPQLFIPITKVDAANRLVYGVATAEAEDRAGEVCDYATSKPYYEKWSGDIAKATDGRSLGNVRAMHGKIAAGKVTTINFNDDKKQIEICAKVVDDAEWQKCLEGVYTGFSQGGSYVKRWKEDGVQKYTANPSEVSLVDLPCLPSATFEIIKADGLTEAREFKAPEPFNPSNDDVKKLAVELAEAAGKPGRRNDYLTKARAQLIAKAAAPDDLVEDLIAEADAEPSVEVEKSADPVAELEAALEKAKAAKDDGVEYADPKNKKYPLDTAKRIKAAWSYIHMPKNQKDYSDAEVKAIEAKIVAAWKAKIDPDGPPSAEKMAAFGDLAKSAVGLSSLIKRADGKLEKGLYTVAMFCQVVDAVAQIQQSAARESEQEGDASTVPAQLAEDVSALCTTLVAMLAEEVGEIIQAYKDQGLDIDFDPAETDDDDDMAYAASVVDMIKADAALMEKVGARNSKRDQDMIQNTHDSMVKLGAHCDSENVHESAKEDHEKVALAAENERLTKAVSLATPAVESLTKAMADQGDVIARLEKRITELEAQPLPPKTAASAYAGVSVEKGADSAGKASAASPSLTVDQVAKSLADLPEHERNLMIMKAALARPIVG